MITLEVGEKEQFQYNSEELAIYAADDEGSGWSYTWRIKFTSKEQIEDFKDMLELMVETLEGKRQYNDMLETEGKLGDLMVEGKPIRRD